MWCFMIYLVCAAAGQTSLTDASCWTPGGCGIKAEVIGEEIYTDSKSECVQHCKQMAAAFAQHGSYGRPRSCLCRPANCLENLIPGNMHPGIVLSTAHACLGAIQPPCETRGGCSGSSMSTEVHMRSKQACALHCQRNRSSLAQYGALLNPHSCVCKVADCLEKALPGSEHPGVVLSTSHQCLGNVVAPPCWGVNQTKCLEADLVQEGKYMQDMMISVFDVQINLRRVPLGLPIISAAALALTCVAAVVFGMRRRTWERESLCDVEDGMESQARFLSSGKLDLGASTL